ncbi:MAG: hypothetical protein AAF559_01165 [Pseudomonadota bacterium]
MRDMNQGRAQRVDECPADWTQFGLAPRNPQATFELEEQLGAD